MVHYAFHSSHTRSWSHDHICGNLKQVSCTRYFLALIWLQLLQMTRLRKYHLMHLHQACGCLHQGNQHAHCDHSCTLSGEDLLLHTFQGTWTHNRIQVPYMARHLINKDVLWPNHTCNTSICIRGCAPSIQSLCSDTVSHLITNVLIFRFIWGQYIDDFQLDLVAMDHVSGCSQWWYIVLWDNVILINCFHHWIQFSHCNLFHTLMTPFHNVIDWWDVRTVKS